MSWESAFALVALAFAIVCFALFVKEALKRPPAPETVVAAAVADAGAAGLDPRVFGILARELAAAFSKIGPGFVALIGAILFLLLGGEAVNVYNLTGNVSAEEGAAPGDEDATGNEAEGNETDGNETEGNEAEGNGADGNGADEAGV